MNLVKTAVCLCFALSTASTFAQQSSVLHPELPMEWEAEVQPPPEGQWIRNMPGGIAPREPRGLPTYAVRVFYLVPSNRTAMPDAVARLRDITLRLQAFYADEMERNGFGSKTFALETEADGVTPRINIVNAPNTDDYYRADPWGRVPTAAQSAGLPVWSPRQVWLGAFQAHVMNPDGSITGEFNGGSTFGSGDDAGLGITNSNSLALARYDLLTTGGAYNGRVLPELGSYPMVYGVTAGTGDGINLGHLASVRYGVFFHELSHGFGLPHDFRNDQNFKGNLLGNGFRGIRSRLVEDNPFITEETRLSYGDALALNVSRYFNGAVSYTDNTKPTLAAQSNASISISNGLMPVSFTASDTSGLAMARLLLSGNTVDEKALSGTSANSAFNTPFYNKSGANGYTIQVFDVQGNRQSVDITLTPVPGSNQAPQPFFSFTKPTVEVGEAASAYVGFTTDDATSKENLQVQWDWDGDGFFETAPAAGGNVTFTNTYATPGNRLVRMKVTDQGGASAISTPIALRVTAPNSTVPFWELY